MSTDPITDIIFVSNPQARPSGYFILEQTAQGNDGQMYEATWMKKAKRYLCFTKDSNQTQGSKVIIELTIITDDSKVPTGFTAISNAKDDNEKALRKHQFCIKAVPRQQAIGAICDIVLINKGKGEPPPPGYFTISNAVNELNVCYRTGPVAQHPVMPPTGHQYSYSSPPHPVAGVGRGPAQPQQQQQWFGYQQHPPHVSRPQQQVPVKTPASPTSPTTEPPKISILDGVPFEISPKFSMLWKKGETSLPAMQRLSVGDVGRKYEYSFHSERSVVGSR